MATLTWTTRYAAALVLFVALAGCGAPVPPPPSSAPVTTAPSTTSAGASSSSTSSGPPQTVMGKRCGPPEVESTAQIVDGPDGARLSLVTVGSGGTVALLLHQTDPGGSCGWWPFANQLARNGIRAVMLDFCGWGASVCDTSKAWASDYGDQVVRTTARLRTDGATRITLVGASLGGKVAAVAATQAGADATADLGGFGFGPLVTGPAMAALTVPVLGAGSHTEQSDSEALQQQVATSPSPTKRFVWADAGHGWSLVVDGPFADAPVSAIGTAVIGWVKGDYTA